MQNIDRECCEITDRIRQNPMWLVPHLEKKLSYFEGNLECVPGKTRIRTNEGTRAVQEAIDYCKKAQPVCGVTWNEGLAATARFHCADTGPKGQTGHNSSDGTSMGGRL